MGFNAGFSIIKKANCSFDEMLEASEKAYFEEHEYFKEHYTYDEYRKIAHLDEQQEVKVSDELVEFYKEHQQIEIKEWCSNARYFDDDIKSILKPHGLYYEVDKDTIKELLKYSENMAEQFDLVPVTVTHGIQILNDDEFKISNIDGIQIQYKDRTCRQILNDDEQDVIFASKTLADFEQIYAFRSLKECITELKYIDLDQFFVYYWHNY